VGTVSENTRGRLTPDGEFHGVGNLRPLAEVITDFAEIHVLDVQPLPEWQRELIRRWWPE
jgi:hypothetical protein